MNATDYNVGTSDYAKHTIQPYDIWREYKLDAWRADIIKRVLRSKGTSPEEIQENKRLDLKKIIHICEYLLENNL